MSVPPALSEASEGKGEPCGYVVVLELLDRPRLSVTSLREPRADRCQVQPIVAVAKSAVVDGPTILGRSPIQGVLALCFPHEWHSIGSHWESHWRNEGRAARTSFLKYLLDMELRLPGRGLEPPQPYGH